MTINLKWLRNRCRPCSLSHRHIVIVLAAIVLFWCPCTPMVALGQTEAVAGGIKIKADSSEFHLAESSFEYTGNVKITLETTTISADYIKVFYKKDSGASVSPSANAIDRAIATGNVVIVSENDIAKGDEAVYDSGSQSLVLKGDPAVVENRENNLEMRIFNFTIIGFTL